MEHSERFVPLTKLTLLFVVAISATPLQARDWQVPAEVPTIAAALDSASSGDTVVVACGTYQEANLQLEAGVTLRSETGLPDCAVIDASAVDWPSSMIECWWQQGARLEGLTLTGGHATDWYYGDHGGALRVVGSDLEVVDCVITGNEAYMGGAVVASDTPGPVFRDCVISGNHALSAGGFEVGEGTTVEVHDSVVHGNTVGGNWPDGLVRADGLISLICCEVDLAGWGGDGTVEVDDTDCGSTPVAARSWGAVKALFDEP
jgi:hypothetical protein